MFSARSTLGGTIELELLFVLTQYNLATKNLGDRDWNAGTN
jgi:hypothetical protein